MRRKGFMAKSAALCMAMSMIFTTDVATVLRQQQQQIPKSTSETTTTQAAESTGEQEQATTDKFDKEVSIRVMLWDRGNAAPNTTTENNALTQWIQEQMKDLYNIKVEYVSVPRSGSDDSLNIMMTGGTAPDIVFFL